MLAGKRSQGRVCQETAHHAQAVLSEAAVCRRVAQAVGAAGRKGIKVMTESGDKISIHGHLALLIVFNPLIFI
ncbi:hypothetical protein ABKY47_004357 [Aeromonas hydrophila]